MLDENSSFPRPWPWPRRRAPRPHGRSCLENIDVSLKQLHAYDRRRHRLHKLARGTDRPLCGPDNFLKPLARLQSGATTPG